MLLIELYKEVEHPDLVRKVKGTIPFNGSEVSDVKKSVLHMDRVLRSIVGERIRRNKKLIVIMLEAL